MSKEICEEIRLISEKLLIDIKCKLPLEPAIKFILFTETLRILDFYNVIPYKNSPSANNM
jgi:hypothetical protein